MSNNEKESLSEEELNQVAGGMNPAYKPGWQIKTVVVRRDHRGNATHWQNSYNGAMIDSPYYYVCPHCGRLLHEGTLSRLYCDPCDESWFRSSLTQYVRNGICPGC